MGGLSSVYCESNRQRVQQVVNVVFEYSKDGIPLSTGLNKCAIEESERKYIKSYWCLYTFTHFI